MSQLIDLIRNLPDKPDYTAGADTLTITGITADSRAVEPGNLFVALKGVRSDGTVHAGEAKEAGAVAVLCGKDAVIPDNMPVVRAANPRKVLAQMAAAFYVRQPTHIMAVTGTDGKTSTADFTRQLWELLGKKSASIGTLGTYGAKGELLYPGQHTTPDPVSLHKMLQELSDAGYAHVAMEASSHGLNQYRLDGVRLQAAAFTNLSRDHMDYHGTQEAYFAAKARLFTDFAMDAAVINADDAHAQALKNMIVPRKLRKVIFYGRAAAAMPGYPIVIKHIEPLQHGQKVFLSIGAPPQGLLKKWFGAAVAKDMELELPLVGTFQVYNMLAASGLVYGCSDKPMEEILALLPQLQGVPGRLEHVVQLANGASVYIDYAHTSAALANILTTLRPHTQKRLHVVFGCGGDRDKGKRPEMGAAADRLADVVFVTDDNPRSEEPASIRKAIMEVSPRAKEVADRKQAIYGALKGLEAGDILVIAGKGHEKTQITGDTITPFDDAQVARDGAKELKLL